MASVTMLAQATHRKLIHVVSAHMPSCMRAMDEELDQSDYLQRASESLKGHKRTLVFVGIDAIATWAMLYPRVWFRLAAHSAPPQTT